MYLDFNYFLFTTYYSEKGKIPVSKTNAKTKCM